MAVAELDHQTTRAWDRKWNAAYYEMKGSFLSSSKVCVLLTVTQKKCLSETRLDVMSAPRECEPAAVKMQLHGRRLQVAEVWRQTGKTGQRRSTGRRQTPSSPSPSGDTSRVESSRFVTGTAAFPKQHASSYLDHAHRLRRVADRGSGAHQSQRKSHPPEART